MKLAILFLCWGEKYRLEVTRCLRESRLPNADIFVITDDPPQQWFGIGATIISAEFEGSHNVRKAELISWVPEGYDAYLFLDTDTIVLGDISLGFEAARRHGIAAAPAVHDALDNFFGFETILGAEGVACRGQLLYNSGVIFFHLNEASRGVLHRWKALARRYGQVYKRDQPFLTLAMDQLYFAPYALSRLYNYRAMGEYITGGVRIWHSRAPVPTGLNEPHSGWPPRRVWQGQLETVAP